MFDYNTTTNSQMQDFFEKYEKSKSKIVTVNIKRHFIKIPPKPIKA